MLPQRNEFQLEKNSFLPKTNMKHLMPLNPHFLVGKRKLIKRGKWILEISSVPDTSFLLSLSKHTKENIRHIHFFRFLKNSYPYKNQIKTYCKLFFLSRKYGWDPKCKLNISSFLTLPHLLDCLICTRNSVSIILLLWMLGGWDRCGGWGVVDSLSGC